MFIYETKVHEQWIDYNEHMNVAFYYYAFEAAAIELWGFIGVDQTYRTTEEIEIETREGHIQFIREANIGDSLRIESQIFHVSKKLCCWARKCFVEKTFYVDLGRLLKSYVANLVNVEIWQKKFLTSALSVKISGSDLPDWFVRRVAINRPG